MSKISILKAILLSTCITACSAFFAVTASCGNSGEVTLPTIEGVSFAGEEEKSGPQFLEGALADIQVEDTVRLNEYIDYVEDPYTVTVTGEDGTVTDLTNKTYWIPKTKGTYILTYTIKSGASKGTATFTLNVKNPELTWEFNIQNIPYNYGETLNFNKYFGSMNIFTSMPNCTYVMDSVEVDGEVIDLLGKTEYTFASRSDHIFKFHAESPDGQICEGREVISIKYVDSEYAKELEDMGITLSGDLYVERGKFTTVEGMYCNGNNVWLRRENGPHNLPYIAYNGDYGINSYVKVDFTGKNLPILSFFRDDEYSNSIFDGTKGVVYTGGFTNNSGTAIHKEMCSRGTLYGPYMLHEYDRGAEDTTTIGSTSGSSDMPFGGSLNSLVDGVRYRMIAGFSGIKVGKANLLGTTTSVDTVFLTYECIVINLDTMEIASKFTIDSYGLNALGFEEIPVTDENNEFFTGNIVLYGNHGRRTVLDGIYPIITGKTFDEVCEEELVYSNDFKESAKTFILNSSTVLNTNDYVDTTVDGYIFYYVDENGDRHDITGETFTFEKAGSYILYYSNGINLSVTLPITVADYSDELKSWIKDSKVNLYGVEEFTEEHALTMKQGTIKMGATYQGPNPGLMIDQPYVAFDGNYGLNDYIAFEFTGKNMPEIAFFAKNYNNSMYYQNGGKQGIVVISGITNAEGNHADILYNASGKPERHGEFINYGFPFMIQDAQNGAFTEGAFKSSQLGRANLVDGTKYRVIMGFTEHAESTKITLKWYLYNLDTNEVVEEGSMSSWGFFTGTNAAVNNMTINDLLGSIVLYGKFGTTLSLDKLYGVYEDTTIDKIANSLKSNETYEVKFVGLNGETLKTVQGIAAGTRVSYGGELPTPSKKEDAIFNYTYGWDKPLGLITEDTTYTLQLTATLKDGIKLNNSTVNGTSVVLNSSWIGDGANYTIGQNNGGGVRQSYFAIDGNYGLGTFIAFDFTGKNMPEIAFFAKNYNDSMYAEGTNKQGIVVVTGITTWDGQLGSGVNGNGTQINYGYPYMIQNAADGGFVNGAFAESALGRANLVDGTKYRVIMGFTGSDSTITLHWCLYNLDTNEVVEKSSMTTWGFFSGSESKVGNMTINDLVGSIVLYGKFGVNTTIDSLICIYENTTLDEIVSTVGTN